MIHLERLILGSIVFSVAGILWVVADWAIANYGTQLPALAVYVGIPIVAIYMIGLMIQDMS